MQEKDKIQNVKDMVLSRLREKSDFPAMSNTIDLINKFKSSEDTSITEFSNIILKDYALTSKILKLVNSVNFLQFGEVTTISRAIILLGFENVRNLALTLMLFDHIQKGSSNVEHLNTIVKSYYSGILAQKIAGDINFPNKEEAYICALFHTFGKMMVAFAMPDKFEEIKRYSGERNVSEDASALAILGCRFEEIGMAIAKEWNFPNKIVYSMHKLRGMEITKSTNELDILDSIATFSNELSNIIASGLEEKERNEEIEKLTKAFKTQFGHMVNKLNAFIISSTQDLIEFSSVFSLNLNSIPFSKQLLRWVDNGGDKETSARIETKSSQAAFTSGSLKTIDTLIESEKADTPESIFTKGIQDINNAILSNFSLNDIIRIVLETMYRGMQLSGLANTLFLIKDTKLPVMNVRFGFGNGIDELKKWFVIKLDGSDDIFNIAALKQNDLVIKDIDVQDVRSLLPEWYRLKASPRIFVIILPIVINGKPIGVFYVEGEKENFDKISGSHLNYLKILRDQTVMAVKQKQGY